MNKPNVDVGTFPALYNSEGKVVQIKKLSHRHHAIMDFMLANPTVSMGDVAAHFKVTPAWLSTVRQSDLFKARLAERRRLMDEDQAHRIGSKLAATAEKGIERISDIIDDDEQDGRLQLDSTKVALEALGFIGKAKTVGGVPVAESQPAVQVNISTDVFSAARDQAIAGSNARVINHEEE